METTDLNPADVDELVELLVDAGVRSVGLDPAQLNLPGVWVNVTGFELELASLTIKTELICLAANLDPRRALAALAEPFNQVVGALAELGGPAGDPFTGVWPLGDKRLPGIAVPFDLLTTQETP